MEPRELLKRIALLAGLDEGERNVIVDACKHEQAQPGHVYFRMGGSPASLHLILSGSVKVTRLGTESEIARLETGQSFGEMSFLDSSRTTATVTAMERTEVLVLTRGAFERLVEDHPSLGVKLWRNFAIELKRRLALTNDLVDQYIDMNQVLLAKPAYRDTTTWS